MRRVRLGTVVPWLVLAYAVVVAVDRAKVLYFLPQSMEDLDVYRAGGSALLHGRPLYEAHPPGSGLPFTYTPFAAFTFIPVSLLPVAAARWVWTLVSLAALARSCWLLARAVASRRREPSGGRWPDRAQAFVLLLAFGLLVEPTAETLAFGQVNLLILWLVVEDWLGRPPWRSRGVLTGLATGLKLVPGLFVLFMPLVGRRRELVRALVTVAATFALGFVLQPQQSWSYWTDLAYDPSRVGHVSYTGNQSLNGALARTFGDDYPKAVWLLVAVAVATAALLVGRRLFLRGEPLAGIATVATGMLLASPISWSHHWVWVVVLGAAGLSLAGRWDARVMLALLVLATVPRMIWWPPYGHDAEMGWTGWQLLEGNAYALLGLAFLAFAANVARGLPATPPAPVDQPASGVVKG